MPAYKLRVTPLTPVHVGTGESIAAEDYFLTNNKLVRFRPAAVVRAMKPEKRREYQALLSGDANSLLRALKLLRGEAERDPGTWLYAVGIGAASRQALSVVIEKLETRTGEVRPLFWNEARGTAVIPGSAIKGAIRTAIVAAMAAQRGVRDTAWWKRWTDRIIQASEGNNQEASRELARAAKRFEEDVLGFNSGKLESDPFRFVKVSDGEVAAEGVQVDRSRLVTGQRDYSAESIQMHHERLLSISDGSRQGEFECILQLDHERAGKQQLRGPLSWVPDLDSLRVWCNWHYDRRYSSEKKRFPELYPQALDQSFEAAKAQGVVLRLGRFSHFEALSVEGMRRTLSRNRQWISEGSSRTACDLGNGRKLPYGWVSITIAEA